MKRKEEVSNDRRAVSAIAGLFNLFIAFVPCSMLDNSAKKIKNKFLRTALRIIVFATYSIYINAGVDCLADAFNKDK